MSNDKSRATIGELVLAYATPRRYAVGKAFVQRSTSALCFWGFLCLFAAVPVMSAQESNATSIVMLAYSLFMGVALLTSVTRPVLGAAARGTRVVLARARCAARSIGCTVPQPRTIANLVAVTVVTLTITALLKGPIFDLVVAAVGTQQSPDQIAADADRSTWLGSGWAADIPGLTLIS